MLYGVYRLEPYVRPPYATRRPDMASTAVWLLPRRASTVRQGPEGAASGVGVRLAAGPFTYRPLTVRGRASAPSRSSAARAPRSGDRARVLAVDDPPPPKWLARQSAP